MRCPRVSSVAARLFASISVATAAAMGVLTSPGVAAAQGSFQVLHSFMEHCACPVAPLIQATDGNFYGTSALANMVFQVTPDGTVTVLHAFTGGPEDGSLPFAALIQTTDGNFYGTTLQGGASGSGTVFQMTPDGTVTVLH